MKLGFRISADGIPVGPSSRKSDFAALWLWKGRLTVHLITVLIINIQLRAKLKLSDVQANTVTWKTTTVCVCPVYRTQAVTVVSQHFIKVT